MGSPDRLRSAAFRFRGFTPIPFLILALVFAQPVLWGLVTGLFMICAGEALRFWAVSVAGSETRTTIAPGGTSLVTGGPFAYLRNPIYAGNLVIYSGVGMMSMGLFPWLLLGGLLCFCIQYALIISYEEEVLKNRFGQVYEAYASRVNRFFPRVRAKNAGNQTHSDPSAGLKSEKRTLQAEAIVVALFIGIYVARCGRG